MLTQQQEAAARQQEEGAAGLAERERQVGPLQEPLRPLKPGRLGKKPSRLLAAAAGDDRVRRDDAAEKLEALEEYKLRDDLQARSADAGPVTESLEAKE